MSAFSVNLGSIKALNSISGLELDLNSTVDFSSPMAPTYPHTGVRPVGLLTSREVWVTRGIGCRISIQLLVNEERPVDVNWRANVVECLGRVLREAELWEQLNLHVTLSIPSPPLTTGLDFDQEDIVIHVMALHRPGSHAASQQGGGSAPESASHINPPDGVPRVELNTLRLKLEFTKGKSPLHRKRLRLDPELSTIAQFEGSSTSSTTVTHRPVARHSIPWRPPPGISSLAGDLSTMSYAASSPLPSRSILGQLNGRLGSQPSYLPLSSTSTNNHLGILSESTQSASQKPPSNSYISDREDSAGKKRRSEQGPSAIEGPLSQLSHDPTAFNLELRDMVTLTDAALRSLISYRPQRAPNLRVSKEQLSPSLSAIAPALWSPGYRLAIKKRAPLISKLSKVTCSIFKRCQSPTVRQRFLELSQLPLSPAIPHSSHIDLDETDEPENPLEKETLQNLDQVLQARLWRLMQRLLYNPNAALSLRPLKMSTEHEMEDTVSLGEAGGEGDHDMVPPFSSNEISTASASSEEKSSFSRKPPSSETSLPEMIEGGGSPKYADGTMARIWNDFKGFGSTESFVDFTDAFDESDYEVSCLGDAEDYAELFQQSVNPPDEDITLEYFETDEEDGPLEDGEDLDLHHDFLQRSGGQDNTDPALSMMSQTENSRQLDSHQACDLHESSSMPHLLDLHDHPLDLSVQSTHPGGPGTSHRQSGQDHNSQRAIDSPLSELYESSSCCMRELVEPDPDPDPEHSRRDGRIDGHHDHQAASEDEPFTEFEGEEPEPSGLLHARFLPFTSSPSSPSPSLRQHEQDTGSAAAELPDSPVGTWVDLLPAEEVGLSRLGRESSRRLQGQGSPAADSDPDDAFFELL